MNNTYRREVSCDFFHVSCGPKGDLSLLDVMKRIEQRLPSVKDRNLPTSDGFHRIQGWRAYGDRGEGAFLRLRTVNSASIGKLSSDEVRDLVLGDDEALTEYFCLSYYEEFGTLVVHRNRDAGGYARLEEYLTRQSDSGPVYLRPILTEDALRRMDKMSEFTIAELSVAMPEKDEIFLGMNKSVGELITFAKLTGATTISVRVSMDHSRQPLNGLVSQIWSDVVTHFGNKVRKAKVRGRSVGGQEELMTLDLISDRMKERVDLQITKGRPAMSDIFNALHTAYDRRRDEIQRQFEKRPQQQP